MKKFLLLLVTILFPLTAVFAQYEGNEEHDWYWDFWQFKKPTLELTYGLSNTKIDGIVSEFQNASLGELKIGYSSTIKYSKKNRWSKYFYSFAAIGAFSNQIDFRDEKSNALNFEVWRFGFGKKDGYPLGTDKFSVLPYSSNTYNWSKIKMKQFPDSSLVYDNERLKMYNNTFRFGSLSDGGLGFRFGKTFAINVGYENSNTYQRVLFWKALGSIIIEEVGYGLIDEFVRRVLKENPVAGSIVYFILRNAYSYGIYHLRSQEMNWPFGGESSLNFRTFKTDISFTF